jgi:hypothetical protein
MWKRTNNLLIYLFSELRYETETSRRRSKSVIHSTARHYSVWRTQINSSAQPNEWTPKSSCSPDVCPEAKFGRVKYASVTQEYQVIWRLQYPVLCEETQVRYFRKHHATKTLKTSGIQTAYIQAPLHFNSSAWCDRGVCVHLPGVRQSPHIHTFVPAQWTSNRHSSSPQSHLNAQTDKYVVK